MGDLTDIRRAERMTDHVTERPRQPAGMFIGYGLAFAFLGAWLIVFPVIQPMWPWLADLFRWLGFFSAAPGLLLFGYGLGELWASPRRSRMV